RFAVADTSWTGPTITFNNKPPIGTSPLYPVAIIDTTLRLYQFDVTGYVKQEKSVGHNIVSFALVNPSTSAAFVTFNSGNASSDKPALAVITKADSVGTFTIAAPQSVHVEQDAQIAVSWTVPSGGWRQLSSIKLLLQDEEDPHSFALIKWDEAMETFSLFNPLTGRFGSGKALGSDRVLSNGLIDVLLKSSSKQASGPTSPLVTVTFALKFNRAAAGHRFRIEVSARNDMGSRSAFSVGPVVKVNPIF